MKTLLTALLLTLTLLLLPAPAHAGDTPIGDASHCLELWDNGHAYERCLDEARDDAIWALFHTAPDGTTYNPRMKGPYAPHPDAVPGAHCGGLDACEFDAQGRRSVSTLAPEPYQRYEERERYDDDGPEQQRSYWCDEPDDRRRADRCRRVMTYVFADGTYHNGYPGNARLSFEEGNLKLTWSYSDHTPSYEVRFERDEDGHWNMESFTHDDTYAGRLQAYEFTATVEGRNLAFSTRDEYGRSWNVSWNGECAQINVRPPGGLLSEYPRRCLR